MVCVPVSNGTTNSTLSSAALDALLQLIGSVWQVRNEMRFSRLQKRGTVKQLAPRR